MLKITARLIAEEAKRRNINVEIISEEYGLLKLTFPDKACYLHSMLSVGTPAVSAAIADNKHATFLIAERLGIPTPATKKYTDIEQAAQFLSDYQTIVVKPLDSAHGNGITLGVNTLAGLGAAIEVAQSFSDTILLQQQVAGEDVRLLMIGGELAAAARRDPASIIGDGANTIRQLIIAENDSGMRGENYMLPLNFIDIVAAERYLGSAMSFVPKVGERVQVVATVNIGTGGKATDITDTVDQSIIHDAKRLLSEISMPTAAVDFMVSGDARYLIEINANPSFGLHTYPAEGKSRNVSEKYISWLETL